MNIIISFIILFIINFFVTCYILYNSNYHYRALISTVQIKKNRKLFITSVVLTCLLEDILFTNYLYSYIGVFLGCMIFGLYHIPIVLIINRKLQNDIRLNIVILKVLFSIIIGYHLFIIKIQYSILHSILFHILYNLLSEFLIFGKISACV